MSSLVLIINIIIVAVENIYSGKAKLEGMRPIHDLINIRTLIPFIFTSLFINLPLVKNMI